VVSLQNPVARSAYCNWLAERLQVPPSAVSRALESQLQDDMRGRGGERRAHGPAGPLPGDRGRARAAALPTFETAEARDPALGSLLDLAVHFEAVAHELLDELPAELIPDTPLGRALNLVLATTAAGEWNRAAAALAARQDLVGCPEVARALLECAYARLDPDGAPAEQRADLEQRLHRAAADCVARRRLDDLDSRLQQTAQQLAAETDQARQAELLQQHRALQERRRDIGRQRPARR
jgi:hypothetical protein